MDEEILWVGVRFDPRDGGNAGDYLETQHAAINERCVDWQSRDDVQLIGHLFPSGASIDEYFTISGRIIDVTDSLGSRIGLGVHVASIAEGLKKIPMIKELLNSFGITLHVSVWGWNQESMPGSVVRPAGVDQMVSLDMA